MIKKLPALFLLFAFVWIVSCATDNEDEPRITLRVDMKSDDPDRDLYSFSRADIGVDEIEFASIPEEFTLEFSGNFVIDVARELILPEINALFPEGSYDMIELEMDLAKVLDDGKSIVVHGTFDEQGTLYQFEFNSELTESVEVQKATPTDSANGVVIFFKITIDLPSLFTGINWADANVDQDNIIRINADSNTDLAELIEDRIKDAIDYDDD